ncbi:MAG: hypothetical protein KAR73_07730, partial [Spirochaetales bacterium]|nr:hypothetical protein [Spirochaetales bacterium]
TGFRVVLFFAVPPVLFLAAVVLFLAAVPFFLEVVVVRAFVLFGFAAVELLLPDVFFPVVFVLPPVFPAEVFLPEEVLFLGIGLFLLTKIHSISVFLFMW